MPQVNIPPGHVEIAIQWGAMSPIGSQPINVWGAVADGGWVPSDLAAIDWDSALQSYAAAADSSWLVERVRVRIGASEPPYTFYDFFPDGATGTVTGTALAPNTAALVQKITNTPGRPGRGRSFYPGIPDTSVDEVGLVDPTRRAAIVNGIESMLVELGDGGLLNWVVLHPTDSPLADTPSLVVSTTVAPIVATQRRRQRN